MKFTSSRFSKYSFSSPVSLYYQQAWTVPRWSYFRDTNITPMSASLDNTLMELLASDLYTWSLSLLSPLFILYRIVHQHLFISCAKEGSQLIERKIGFPFREAYIRPLILVFSFIFSPCPSLVKWIRLKTQKHKDPSVGMRFPKYTWRSWYDTWLSLL